MTAEWIGVFFILWNLLVVVAIIASMFNMQRMLNNMDELQKIFGDMEKRVKKLESEND